MNKAKQSRLESKGWKVGTAEEFLGMGIQEAINKKLSELTIWSDRGYYKVSDVKKAIKEAFEDLKK